MADEPLNPKQQQFVREYLIDLNATQAAIRTGYSAKTAAQQASRLLSDVKIANAIKEAMAQRSMRTQITADRVLEEYARIGFADIRDAVNWRSLVVATDDPDDAEDDDSDRDPEEAEARRRERAQTAQNGLGGDAIQRLHMTDIRFRDSDQLSPDTAAAIAEVSVSSTGTVKLKFHDKKGALDSMARHLGILVDKAEVTVTVLHEDRLDRIRSKLNGRREQPPSTH